MPEVWMSHYSRQRRHFGRTMIDGSYRSKQPPRPANPTADGTYIIAARMQQLGFPTYADYLASGHWQALRRRYFATHHGCQECGRSVRIALHHTTYQRLGAERLSDLIGLCDECHRAAHLLADGKKASLSRRT
jgi:HNH endonuclease